MTHTSWGPDGAPREAYSRVTNPERFAPLHRHAEALLEQLASQYDVRRGEGTELGPNIDPAERGRASIRLTPRSELAAPVQVTFTEFPGLDVRVGRWYHDRFPGCGCDACNESIEATVKNLNFLVECTVNGLIREELQVPWPSGDAWQIAEIGGSDLGARSTSRKRIPRRQALAMIQGGRMRYDWQPWSRK